MRNRIMAGYTARMPLPPTDPPAHSRPANPARVMLNSPLAAAMRARVYRERTRTRPPERGLRIAGMVGTLLVHLLFLFSFVLGPAYPPAPPPSDSRDEFLQIRLIEPPEPPPPPPVRGTPPKETGPRHQGSGRRVAAVRERSANVETAVAARPAPPDAEPVAAEVPEPVAPVPEPVAAPPPPVSLPQPAPTPELQPVPLASEPPPIALPEPSLEPPVPPAFQPESVRKPQLEGNQPMLPPPSLALPEVPPQSPPAVSAPTIALQAVVPDQPRPASVTPVRAELPAAPPVPDLQPVPLPAQPSPSINLTGALNTPSPSVPVAKPQVQAPAIKVAEAELAAVPLESQAVDRASTRPASVKIDVADATRLVMPGPSIERPQLSAPVEPAVATDATDDQPAESPSPAVAESAPDAGDSHEDDVSRAPDATPEGSDTATPGQPDGVIDAPAEDSDARTADSSPETGQNNGDAGDGQSEDSGQPGGDQPGADQGVADQGGTQGTLGSYVQLKPRGDTDIMQHRSPDIGYRRTRFEDDWAPEGESSVDTALRRAVEKTTVKHTFHLPRGIRVECAVMPLLPIALLGCGNPDPPAAPLDQSIYDRLNAAPANPLVPPEPASSVAAAPAPAPMIKLDNRAECAAARVAGGPLPPGCAAAGLPARPVQLPASSSSSWVPASDQFQ